jgi:hypothetical protein
MDARVAQPEAEQASGLQWLKEPGPETVFFLGAGLLKNLSERHGIKPPAAGDLFKTAYAYDAVHPLDSLREAKALRFCLQTFFQLTEDDLRSRDVVPIEEIFTLLDSQKERGGTGSARALLELEQLLIDLLTDFEHRWDIPKTDDWDSTMRQWNMVEALAEALLDSRSAQITLNYDTFVEETLTRSAPQRFSQWKEPHAGHPPTLYQQDDGVYGRPSYELPLAYGFHFDGVQLQRSALSRYVTGEKFYALNGQPLYERPLLKLHGSLNWLTDNAEDQRPHVHLGRAWGRPLSARDFRPLIITPLQRKNYGRFPFCEVWDLAERLLPTCRRLIVIGYSFPPTDFETRRLLREAFAPCPVEELVVVNPCQPAQQTAREVVHHTKCTCFADLEEFLASEGLMRP